MADAWGGAWGAAWGVSWGYSPDTGSTQRGDWQVFYEFGKGRKKRWKQDQLDRDELRRIIRKAVLGEVPAVAPYVEQAPAKPIDASRVNKALYRATPFIDYDSIMEDMEVLQRVLSWHYKRQVQLRREEDDEEALIVLLM